MAKKKALPKVKNSSPATKFLDRAQLEFLENVFQNGSLGGALGFPQNQGFPGSAQVSDSTTIFKNLRWYFVSNFRQLLNEAYVELGLVQTIVDVPVDDALRGGIEIMSKQLEEEQLLELQTSLERDDDLTIAAQTAKWNRLFGGAGLIALTDQDPFTPLNVEAITADSDFGFKAADLWELFWDQQDVEGFDIVEDDYESEWFSYYGIELNKTRVRSMKGITAPSFVRPRLRGWGFSVVEMLVRSINQYLKGTDLGFEVLDEFKLDVYKIKNLVNTLLSPNGEEKIRQRVQLANWQKNYQNALVMDSEDDFDHKQLSFAGLAEAMQGIRMQVASDMRMPMIKLFGTPASGLGADDEESLEVYNSMVESDVRAKLKPVLRWMLELKCQRLFGFIPDDLDFKFQPLRVLSATDEEEVKNKKFDRALRARQAGEITTKEFRECVNKGRLLDVALDTKNVELNPEELGVVEETTDPMGANRPDSQKSKAPKKEAANV
jgi:phage-related protein (TIGR01555 family)